MPFNPRLPSFVDQDSNMYVFDFDYTILNYNNTYLMKILQCYVTSLLSEVLSSEEIENFYSDYPVKRYRDFPLFRKYLDLYHDSQIVCKETLKISDIESLYDLGVYETDSQDRFQEFFKRKGFNITKENMNFMHKTLVVKDYISFPEYEHNLRFIHDFYASIEISFKAFILKLFHHNKREDIELTKYEHGLSKMVKKIFDSETDLRKKILDSRNKFLLHRNTSDFEKDIVKGLKGYISNYKEIFKVFEVIKRLRKKGKVLLIATSRNEFMLGVLNKLFGSNGEEYFDYIIGGKDKANFFDLRRLDAFKNYKGIPHVYTDGCYYEATHIENEMIWPKKTFVFDDTLYHGIVRSLVQRNRCEPMLIDRYKNKTFHKPLIDKWNRDTRNFWNIKCFKTLLEAVEYAELNSL